MLGDMGHETADVQRTGPSAGFNVRVGHRCWAMTHSLLLCRWVELSAAESSKEGERERTRHCLVGRRRSVGLIQLIAEKG